MRIAASVGDEELLVLMRGIHHSLTDGIIWTGSVRNNGVGAGWEKGR
jgi:hypothetical protein